MLNNIGRDKMKKTLLFIFLFTSGFGQTKPEADYKMSATGQAIPTFIGRIIMLKGSAHRLGGDGRRYALKVTDKIKKSHVIETNKGSFMKIKLVDKSIFTLAGQSKVDFKSYDYKSPKDRSGVFSLLKGKMRASIPVKNQKNAFKIIAGKASMGVRGTKFLVNRRMDKQGNDVTQMALLEGDVEVTNVLTKEKVGLLPGDHLIFVEDKAGKPKEDKIEKLEEKTVEELKAVDEEEKKILPFLPYYYVKEQKMEKKTSFQVMREGKKKKKKSSSLSREEILLRQSKNWKRELRILNKTLRENKKGPEEIYK